MIEGAVYQGEKVAIQYYQPAPKYVVVGGKEYVAIVEHSVSMVLADEEDVPALLNHEGGCCGNKRHVFSLAGQEAFNIWKTGRRD